MENIVLQIHALEEKFGIIIKNLVFVLDKRFSSTVLVFLLKYHAQVVKYGMQIYMLVNALMDFGLMVKFVKKLKNAKAIRFIILLIINVNALLDLFGFLQSMHVEILLVKLVKDGMDMDVLKLLVLLDLIIMELNVFVLYHKNKNVILGNISTEFNVFTSHNNVHLGLNGTKQLVFQ